jgi:CDP-glycerol glycerophosphotransferase
VFKKIFIYLILIAKLFLGYALGLFLYVFKKEYRGVWIIAERGKDARDNGYHLFKYIAKNHPEVNAYYVIDYNTPDYYKVAMLGNTVKYGSMKHYILFAISKMKISTHIMGYAPDNNRFQRIDQMGLLFGKKIFLQHGITKDNLTYLYFPNVKLDLFVCGANTEYKYVREKFGHSERVVQYLGFCRYDELSRPHKTYKQILLMPTWRTYIAKCNNVDEFTQTEFFRVYQSLINNDNLHLILKKYGYNLIFYPHYEVQKYINSFSSISDCIKIASFDKYDVQNLLMESAVLITDFSSVFFDFAYMKKPVIFYQFDETEYRNKHYSQGYFSYLNNGFGSVVTDEKHLIDELDTVLKNGALLNEKYLDRVNSFFAINDMDNCRRNFNAIKKLM